MCGIVGIVSRRRSGFWQRDMELMEMLLIVDSLRGKDSVGCFTAYRNKQAEFIKLGSDPYNLFRCKEWDAFKNKVVQRGRIAIGHNRAATRGAVSTENAHPFVENNIMLVHNGTLHSHKNISGDSEFEVDSHAIAHALSNEPPETVIPKLRGAFALVWFDTEKQRLFAVRNESRPLCLIKTDDLYVLSSEPFIAALPLERQNQKIQDITQIEPFELYEFDLHGNVSTRSLPKTEPYKNTWDEWQKEKDKGTAPFTPAAKVEEPPADKKSCILTQSNKFQKDPLADAIRANSNSQNDPTGHSQKPSISPTKSIEERDRDAYLRTQQIQMVHPSLGKGRLVVFKPFEITPVEDGNGIMKFRGKLHEPNELLVDVLGLFSAEFSAKEYETSWKNRWCIGHIMFVTNTNGGLSTYLNRCRKANVTQVWGQNIVPLSIWTHAQTKCKCFKCGNGIEQIDKNFTSVAPISIASKTDSSARNMVRVMCADCVEQTLLGQDRENFKTKRNQAHEAEAALSNSTVQAGKQLSPGTGQYNGKIIILPDSKTLQ